MCVFFRIAILSCPMLVSLYHSLFIIGTPPPTKRSQTNKSPPETKKSHTETEKSVQSVKGNLSGAYLNWRFWGCKNYMYFTVLYAPFLGSSGLDIDEKLTQAEVYYEVKSQLLCDGLRMVLSCHSSQKSLITGWSFYVIVNSCLYYNTASYMMRVTNR